MIVQLLGTGSADGWPNPFCRCPSCTSERTAGRTRCPTAALVDGCLLLDAGPTAAAAAGVSVSASAGITSRIRPPLRAIERIRACMPEKATLF